MKGTGHGIRMLGHEIACNEGPTDRAFRIVAGVALLAAAGFASGGGRIALALLGVVGLFTGLLGFCPLYVPFGLCTRRDREKGGPSL